jgi:hypothetical protein
MTWESLTALVRTVPGMPEEPALAERLYRAFKAVARPQRKEALAALLPAVAAGGQAPWLIVALAAVPRNTAHYLALLLTAGLPAGLDRTVLEPLRPLLADKRLPLDARRGAAVALLRLTRSSGRDSLQILRALTTGTGKARTLKRLRQLERKTGPLPAIRRLRARIEQRQRMRCPRCGVQLRRPDMVKHLWQEHQLVLEGQSVREPWKLIENWVQLYSVGGDATLLGRCQALAEQLEPDNGLLRVYRLFLLNQIKHAEGLQVLRDEAGRRGACLCPRCFAFVPVHEEPAVRPLNVSRGRIAAPGYSVEVADRGFVSHLEIEVPGAAVYHGPEPLWRLTRSGATLLFVGPPVGAAFLLAVVLAVLHLPPLLPVAGFLIMALGISLFVRLRWRPRTDLLDRAVHYAWTLLVPWLHRDGFSVADSEFIAGLALTSINHGRPDTRARALEQLLTVTEQAAGAPLTLPSPPTGGEGRVRAGPASHLAMLWRLATEDAVTRGHDAVRWVITQVGRCFEGKLPLAFAQHLLADWESNCWDAVSLARLRVLLCDRAFENGLEVGDLADLSRVVPALADAMLVDDEPGLEQLRLLWSLRPTRTWDACGTAVTVFELAEQPATATLLAEHPDLLLADPDKPEVYVTTRGIIFRDCLLTSLPPDHGIRRRRSVFGSGYELEIGPHRLWFSYPPDADVERLLRWLRFYFQQFLPRVPDVRGWRSPGLPRALQGRDTVTCPECRRPLLGRRGEVGAAIRPPEGE